MGRWKSYRSHRPLGAKHYELSNHLGNVLATVSDRKLWDGATRIADVKSASDYYPFGMAIGDRTMSSSGYRYGFNNYEKDDELSGNGNSYDFGARLYDARISRFLSVDPKYKSYPTLSPFMFGGNTPISAIDNKGENFIILTWHPKPGNQGHAAIAIQNWKTVIENGVEKQVEDGYVIYDVFPEEGFRDPDHFADNVDRIVGGFARKTVVKTKQQVLDFTYDLQRESTGAVEFTSSASDDLSNIAVLNSLVLKKERTNEYERDPESDSGANRWIYKKYNKIKYSLTENQDVDNCTFSCASFVSKNAVQLYGIEGRPTRIKTKGGLIYKNRSGSQISVPPIDKEAYTPNSVFRNASRQGTVLKGENTRANKTPFLNAYTSNQLKNEN